MIDRRHFIKLLAGLPPLLALKPGIAAADSSRIALVVGNGAYAGARLENPGNDAIAMSALLASAGFSVRSKLDTTRGDLLGALNEFGAAMQMPETKLALFYYAGHGAQLDWRNYLLPIDAAVTKAEDVEVQCVDLGILLEKMSAAREKTFIVILDACRNDPFNGRYQPKHQGLSQFDAPVGSLLAYATSPGNVASDGIGKNGLYTEHLLRELANPEARIEDALKRVRLNVRLASDGAQIPWETTSLESDVFIFGHSAKTLSEAEMEALFEAEMDAWSTLKSSKDPADWIAYLRIYPNGRFAEIASNRLNRLLRDRKPHSATAEGIQADSPKPQPKPVAETQALATQRPLLVLKPGGDMKLNIAVVENPNSAGRFPLGKKFSVGDMAEMRISDLLTGVVTETVSFRVTRVDEENNRVEWNDGKFVVDTMGNFLRSPNGGETEIPQQHFPEELQVGKKWQAGWLSVHPKRGKEIFDMNFRVTKFESVTAPAGTFRAFVVEGKGWINGQGPSRRLELRRWVVPGLNFYVRAERVVKRLGNFVITERQEMVSTIQHVIDIPCSTFTEGKTRSLTIENICTG